ncbi:MAG: NHL repeat-containing protein [Candidatus Schekmanbacteria bacterium]|nr:NHL repeat-containing protein [Candidatus Schekmanbacteria bacterium]
MRFRDRFPEEERARIGGVCAAGDGAVFVADTFGHCVLKVDRDGEIIAEIGRSPHGRPGFRYPKGLLVAGDRLLICDSWNHRIRVFRLDGTDLGGVGGYGRGDSNFCEPTVVVQSPHGEILILDRGNHRICRYAADLRFTAAVDWGSTRRACRAALQRILMREPDDIAIPELDFPHDLFAAPHGAFVLDRQGALAVTDTAIRRVSTLPRSPHCTIVGANGRGLVLFDREDRALARDIGPGDALEPISLPVHEGHSVLVAGGRIWAYGDGGLVPLMCPAVEPPTCEAGSTNQFITRPASAWNPEQSSGVRGGGDQSECDGRIWAGSGVPPAALLDAFSTAVRQLLRRTNELVARLVNQASGILKQPPGSCLLDGRPPGLLFAGLPLSATAARVTASLVGTLAEAGLVMSRLEEHGPLDHDPRPQPSGRERGAGARADAVTELAHDELRSLVTALLAQLEAARSEAPLTSAIDDADVCAYACDAVIAAWERLIANVLDGLAAAVAREKPEIVPAETPQQRRPWLTHRWLLARVLGELHNAGLLPPVARAAVAAHRSARDALAATASAAIEAWCVPLEQQALPLDDAIARRRVARAGAARKLGGLFATAGGQVAVLQSFGMDLPIALARAGLTAVGAELCSRLQALSLDSHPSVAVGLCRSWVHTGNLDAAIALERRLRDAGGPAHVQVAGIVAEALAACGRVAEALACIEPVGGDLRQWCSGVIHHRSRCCDRALAAFERLPGEETGWPRTVFVASALACDLQWPKALRVIQARALPGGGTLGVLTASLLALCGRRAEALQSLNLMPFHPGAGRARALALRLAGDFSAALDALAGEEELCPHWLNALLEAITHFRAGDPVRGAHVWQTAPGYAAVFWQGRAVCKSDASFAIALRGLAEAEAVVAEAVVAEVAPNLPADCAAVRDWTMTQLCPWP